MSNPPTWGRDDAEAPVGSGESSREASHKGNGTTPQNRNSRSKPDARQQAVNDAHQSLQSLLNPQTPEGHPRVISSSGITHRAHGRVVGPTSEHHRLAGPVSGRSAGHIAIGPGSQPASGSKLPALRTHGANALAESPEEAQTAPDTRLGAYTARAGKGLALVRKQAGLFLDEPGDAQPAVPPPARTASSWASRHATLIVVLALVAVVAFAGGVKLFSPQSAVNHELAAAQSDTGNDADETGYNDTNQNSTSDDFQLALPRTQAQGPGQGSPDAMPPDVTRYTVAKGDTIQSIADRFNVMPETVMGSNGIFDSQEELAPGKVLVIPPVDGMYYVAQKGDTLDEVAHRFQVEPDAITSYKRNVVNPNGTLKEGQALVVPGGMLPERQTVISYTVRKGDTLKSIAARFEIDVPTMINSNNIPDPDNLQPGSTLRVLPVPGVEYKVKKGDNLRAIASRMGVTPQMILDYQPNHLSLDSVLHIDQVIIVPGGDPSIASATGGPESEAQAPAIAAARIQPASRGNVAPGNGSGSSKGDGGTVKPKSDSNSAPPPAVKQPQPKTQPKTQPKQDTSTGSGPTVGTGRFIWPVSGAVITQYFTRSHNGVDLAVAAGTPIHAADSGRVMWAGWRTDGLGYCVIIDHLDGYSTVYGHQIRQPAVHVGQYVTRGQLIGWVGSTGHSTGPHVHFMIKGGSATSHSYLNPLRYLP